MSTTTWTGTDGNWTDSTWTNGVPDASLDAVIEGTQSSPITVTFDTASGAARALLMKYATLAVSGGALTLETQSSLDALNQTGGLLVLDGRSEFAGPVTQSGGTIEINNADAVNINDGGTLGGTLTGSGSLYLAGGAVTLGSGLALSVAALIVENTTALAGNIVDKGYFGLSADATLELAGHLFAADAGSSLSGVLEGPGILGIGAHSGVGGLTATGGATIHDYGTVKASGLLTLDAATLAIGPGAHYELEGTSGIVGNNHSVIEVDGVLEDSAPSGTTSISAGIIEDAGIIENGGNDLVIAAGTFAVTGTGEVSTGFGSLTFDPGVVNTNLVEGTLSGGIWDAEAGALFITGGPITTDAATIDLVAVPGNPAPAEFAAGNGTTFTPIQDSLTTITQGGVLDVSGQSYVTTNNVVDNGTLELSGGDQFGSLSIGATGELVEVSNSLTAASIRSAGTVYVGGNDTEPNVVFQAPFASTGTLYDYQYDWLFLAGTDNLIQGAAYVSSAIVLNPNASLRLGPLSEGSFIDHLILRGGDTLTLGASFADRGAFSAPYASTIDLGGHDLTFEGAAALGSDSGAILQVVGTGTLVLANPHAGASSVGLNDVAVAGGIVLDNRGNAGVGTLTLGDAAGGTASLVNEAGATLVLGTSAIDVAEPSADTVANAGLLEGAMAGISVIGANFTNTGTIDITAGTLEITGAFINSGVIIGTETQAGGTTYITAAADPSLTLFNQYRAATAAPAAGTFAPPPAAHVNPPVLASPHA